jgi:hypothetical protein
VSENNGGRGITPKFTDDHLVQARQGQKRVSGGSHKMLPCEYRLASGFSVALSALRLFAPLETCAAGAPPPHSLNRNVAIRSAAWVFNLFSRPAALRRGVRRLEQAFFKGVSNRLGLAVEVQLFQNILNVISSRKMADIQLLSYSFG